MFDNALEADAPSFFTEAQRTLVEDHGSEAGV